MQNTGFTGHEVPYASFLKSNPIKFFNPMNRLKKLPKKFIAFLELFIQAQYIKS